MAVIEADAECDSLNSAPGKSAWACTNQAESFFSRLRRMEIGTHHHIAGPYLHQYAAEASWREDNRRVSNGAQAMTVAACAMVGKVSRQWAGYWQRDARKA